jgi:hypothetical protein
MEQLTLPELIPHLGPNTHAAAGALLVVDARDSGAATGADAVEAGQPLLVNRLAQGFPLDIENRLPFGHILQRYRYEFAGFVQRQSQLFDLASRGSQDRLLRLGAFQAGEFLGFKTFNLAFSEVNFVFDRRGLRSGCHRILLGLVAGGLLAVALDVALKSRSQGIFAAECVGGRSRLALCSGQCGLSFRDFRGQSASLQRQSSTLQFHALQFYQALNVFFHL